MQKDFGLLQAHALNDCSCQSSRNPQTRHTHINTHARATAGIGYYSFAWLGKWGVSEICLPFAALAPLYNLFIAQVDMVALIPTGLNK